MANTRVKLTSRQKMCGSAGAQNSGEDEAELGLHEDDQYKQQLGGGVSALVKKAQKRQARRQEGSSDYADLKGMGKMRASHLVIGNLYTVRGRATPGESKGRNHFREEGSSK